MAHENPAVTRKDLERIAAELVNGTDSLADFMARENIDPDAIGLLVDNAHVAYQMHVGRGVDSIRELVGRTVAATFQIAYCAGKQLGRPRLHVVGGDAA